MNRLRSVDELSEKLRCVFRDILDTIRHYFMRIKETLISSKAEVVLEPPRQVMPVVQGINRATSLNHYTRRWRHSEL